MDLCGFKVGLDQPLFLIAGPCVVEEYGSTTVVPSNWFAQVDTAGNLILKRQDA